ncbi:MAG: transcriptional regulator [Hyphomonas sp.]
MSGSGIEKIDDVIHGRLRMGVMAFLSQSESASFTELKDALGVTQGNLSIQLRKLEDAGYISVNKQIVGRKALTTLRITAQGRTAFADYLKALSDLLGLDGQP